MNIFEYAEKANGKNKPAGNKKNRSIQLIHYSKINPDIYNDVVYSKSPRFNDDSIITLAEAIKIAGEIKEPLIVKKTDIGEYKLIAGHRRRLAVIKLIEEGYEQFAMVPCIIDNSTDNMDRFNLIMTNASQGERTDADKAREVKELNDIINQLIANGEIEAMSARELRKYISKQLNVSETKVAQYNNINNNLNEAAKEEFKNGGIGVSVANELAGLDETSQDELIKEHGDVRSISIKDVKKAKQAKKKPFEKADVVLPDKPKPSHFFPKIDESSCEAVGGDNANSRHDNSSPAGLLGSVSESDTEDDEPIPGQMSFKDYPGVIPVSDENADNAGYSIKKIDFIFNKSFLCFARQNEKENLIAIFTEAEDAFEFCTKKEIMNIYKAGNEYYYKAMPEADTESTDNIFFKGKIDIQGGWTDMIFDAIVYSDQYVYEEPYSAELHKKTGIPYYSFIQAKSAVRDNANIIYVGTVFKRNRIENYKKMTKKYNAGVVCVIYIDDTVDDDNHLDSIFKKNHIDKGTHIVFLQNYIDKQSFINCNMTPVMTDWFIKNCVPNGL